MKDQFIGMNIKEKVIIKIQQTILDFFLNEMLGVNSLFALVYRNRDAASWRFKAKYLPKGIINKGFYDEAIDSDIKRYQEIRKLILGPA